MQHGELVAIDLETTGLDNTQDEIIEVGAVKMRDGVVVEEFGTLVRPTIDIPERATVITGIKTQDVLKAPAIAEIMPELTAFIGDAPIIGHNITFDIGFLEPYLDLSDNVAIDTYELASVLLPDVARYNLHHLTNVMEIQLDDAHRALDDARAAGLLYWALYQKALTLPLVTLRTITKAAKGLKWQASYAFQAALEIVEAADSSNGVSTRFSVPETQWTQPEPLIDDSPDAVPILTPQQVEAVFARDGSLANSVDGYDFRPQQLQMATAISESFNNDQHLFVEAGTGTGKSIAYLVPAILWATQTNRRVVIATNTLNLQDQLVNKDIPALQDALDVPFRAAVLKGQSNYLCLTQLESMRFRGPTSVDELRVFAKILVWRLSSITGDKNEINLRGATEHSIWERLSSGEGRGCRSNYCQTVLKQPCPLFKARSNAEAAHVIVVNHALLITDGQMENSVIPPYDYLIIDEGHHLEDAITNAMSRRIDAATFNRWVNDLRDAKRGILAEVIEALRASKASPEIIGRFSEFTTDISQVAKDMVEHVKSLFDLAKALVIDETGGGSSEYSKIARLEASHRSSPNFDKLSQTWAILYDFSETLSSALTELSIGIKRISKKTNNIQRLHDIREDLDASARFFVETQSMLNAFILQPDANQVYWIEATADGRKTVFHTAPIEVGEYVMKDIWNASRSTILTSATLRTNGSFDYLKERLNAHQTHSVELGSPFDYANNVLVYVVNDVPEPNEYAKYQAAVEKCFVELAVALNGRMLGLFTSYSQLRQTARTIAPRLKLGDIDVFDQSDGSSRQVLIEGFKQSEKGILMGTRSFWEGVDIPGDDLSAVIMPRLPFPVPSDPVIAARGATYDNSFREYTIPEAILRFRQGFGRLIRSKTDRGIVVLLDRRILSKRYGIHFLDALPETEVIRGRLEDLPAEAEKWLSEGQ